MSNEEYVEENDVIEDEVKDNDADTKDTDYKVERKLNEIYDKVDAIITILAKMTIDNRVVAVDEAETSDDTGFVAIEDLDLD